MAACERPGCVSDTVEGSRLCVVHAGDLTNAVPCPTCKGSGRRQLYDKCGGYHGIDPCDKCGATGLKDRTHRTPTSSRHDVPMEQRGLIVAAEEDV